MAVYKHALGDYPWAATIKTLIADSSKALAGGKIGRAEEISREEVIGRRLEYCSVTSFTQRCVMASKQFRISS